MGGAIGGLLGDKPASSKTKSQPTMTPEQQALLKQVLAKLGSGLNQASEVGQFDPTKSDTFAAPLSNLQKLSLTSLENMSNEMGSTGTYTAATDALIKQLETGGKQDITDTFQKSIVNPLTKQFTDVTLPGVTGNFAGTGAYGSDKMKQQNLALRDFNDSVIGAGAKLSYDAGDAANKNILQALGLVPSVTGAGIDNSIKTLNAGGVPQATQQKGIDNNLAYLNNQNIAKNAKLQAILAALGLKGTENITTVDPGSSSGSSLLGAGVKAWGTAAAGGLVAF